MLLHYKATDEASTVFGGHLCSVLTSIMRSNSPMTQVKDSFTNWAVHSGAFVALLNTIIHLSLMCSQDVNQAAAATSLHQALCLLETLTSYHHHEQNAVWKPCAWGGAVAEWFQSQGYMAMLRVLGALVLDNKQASTKSQSSIDRLTPVELLELLILATRTLNNLASLDLQGMQTSLGLEGSNGELLHLLTALLDFTLEQIEITAATTLLSELLLFIGHYVLDCQANQETLHYGQRPISMIIAKEIPSEYLFEPKFQQFMFPTLMMVTFNSEQNKRIVAEHISLSSIVSYICSDATVQEEATRESLQVRFPLERLDEAIGFLKIGLEDVEMATLDE